jgi:hypothetical protein
VYYSYDYRITKEYAKKFGMEVDPVYNKAKNGQEVLEIMADRMQSAAPEIANSLRDFARLNQNPSDASIRLWIFQQNHLPNIKSYSPIQTSFEYPIRCADHPMQQAVIYFQKDKRSVYRADSSLLDLLAQPSDDADRVPAVQESFLFIHEWLREKTDSDYDIALLDRYLHSANWAGLSREALLQKLDSLGLHSAVSRTPGKEVVMAVQQQAQSDLRRRFPIGQYRGATSFDLGRTNVECDLDVKYQGQLTTFTLSAQDANGRHAYECSFTEDQLTKWSEKSIDRRAGATTPTNYFEYRQMHEGSTEEDYFVPYLGLQGTPTVAIQMICAGGDGWVCGGFDIPTINASSDQPTE